MGLKCFRSVVSAPQRKPLRVLLNHYTQYFLLLSKIQQNYTIINWYKKLYTLFYNFQQIPLEQYQQFSSINTFFFSFVTLVDAPRSYHNMRQIHIFKNMKCMLTNVYQKNTFSLYIFLIYQNKITFSPISLCTKHFYVCYNK